MRGPGGLRMSGNAKAIHSRRRLANTATVVLVLTGLLAAHPFIPQTHRIGTYPAYYGNGWSGEAFLTIPEPPAGQPFHLLYVESYVAGRTADFTFRTPWIDFPSGPVPYRADSEFETVGDFLDDYIYEVSDPAKLDEPFGHLYLRFRGYMKAVFADETRLEHPTSSLPLWVDFGSMGYDGYRTTVGGVNCYRVVNVNIVEDPWYNFGPGVEVPGLYPIEVTYFNRHDPDRTLGAPYAGFELYSWHGTGFPWPSGERAVHAVKGPMTLAPPEVIYAFDDAVPALKGDFDADLDFDLQDVQGMQGCFGAADVLAAGCDWMDLDGDVDIDSDDFAGFVGLLAGPE